MDWNPRALSRLALFSALLLSACGGGSSGGGSASPVADPLPSMGALKVTGRVLLTTAAVDDLASFSAVVRSLRVELTTGLVLDNLLPEPVRVEILGLEDTPLWLLSTEYPGTNVQALLIEFDPASYRARALDGSVLSVNALGNTLRAEFLCPPRLFTAPPIDVFNYRSDALETLMVNIDMLDSVRGDVTLGSIDFDPRGATVPVSRAIGLRIEEVDGLHILHDEMAREVQLQGFSDDERELSLGMLPIELGADTLLLNQDGSVLSIGAFFDAIRPGLTISEAHGLLPSRGVLQAARIEIEEQDRGVADTFPVKLAGRIVQKLDLPFPQIELMIQEIEKGAAIVEPVLIGLGDPATILIALDDPDLLVLSGNQIASVSELLVGQRVKVKFEAFSAPPFDAVRLDVPDFEARVSGELFSVNGLPNSFVLHVKEGEPAITGPPDAPTIQARRVKVKSALLSGATVTSVTPPTGVGIVGGEMLGSFGNDVTPGGVQWLFFEPESIFFGAAKTREELFDVFNGLRPGQHLEVDVKGIGLGGIMEINAYQVHSRVVQ